MLLRNDHQTANQEYLADCASTVPQFTGSPQYEGMNDQDFTDQMSLISQESSITLDSDACMTEAEASDESYDSSFIDDTDAVAQDSDADFGCDDDSTSDGSDDSIELPPSFFRWQSYTSA